MNDETMRAELRNETPVQTVHIPKKVGVDRRDVASGVRNGILQAVVIMAILSSVVGWFVWKDMENRKREADAREYLRAMDEAERFFDERDRQRKIADEVRQQSRDESEAKNP